MITHANRVVDCAVFVDAENLSQAGMAVAIAKKCQAFGNSLDLRAYAHWSRQKSCKFEYLHAGFDVIDAVPCSKRHKNLVDMQIVADAVELALRQPQVSKFVIASCDLDFVPLIRKLKDLNRRVICMNCSSTALQLKAEADGHAMIGKLSEIEIIRHPTTSAILRIANECSQSDKPIHLARLGIEVKQRLPAFYPRREFGVNWKSFVLLLEKHSFCKVQTIESTGALLVQFNQASVADHFPIN